jgi:hypothetical protein
MPYPTPLCGSSLFTRCVAQMQPHEVSCSFALTRHQQVDQREVLAASALCLIAVDGLAVFHETAHSVQPPRLGQHRVPRSELRRLR